MKFLGKMLWALIGFATAFIAIKVIEENVNDGVNWQDAWDKSSIPAKDYVHNYSQNSTPSNAQGNV